MSTSTGGPVIEWNAHLFSSDTTSYPFHPRATYTPNPATLSPDPLATYREMLRCRRFRRVTSTRTIASSQRPRATTCKSRSSTPGFSLSAC